MWIPQPVYEILPPVYGIAGVVTIFYQLHPINIVSGVLLVAAGVTVWWQRRDSRRYGGSRRFKPSGKRLGSKL